MGPIIGNSIVPHIIERVGIIEAVAIIVGSRLRHLRLLATCTSREVLLSMVVDDVLGS